MSIATPGAGAEIARASLRTDATYAVSARPQDPHDALTAIGRDMVGKNWVRLEIPLTSEARAMEAISLTIARLERLKFLIQQSGALEHENLQTIDIHVTATRMEIKYRNKRRNKATSD